MDLPSGTSCHIGILPHQYNLQQKRFAQTTTLPHLHAILSTIHALFSLMSLIDPVLFSIVMQPHFVFDILQPQSGSK
jgi:hypothetical protein